MKTRQEIENGIKYSEKEIKRNTAAQIERLFYLKNQLDSFFENYDIKDDYSRIFDLSIFEKVANEKEYSNINYMFRELKIVLNDIDDQKKKIEKENERINLLKIILE